MDISFIEKEKYLSRYGCSGQGEFTPIYMIKDDKEYFIKNIVKKIGHCDGYDKNDYLRQIENMEEVKNTLMINKGNYFKNDGRFENPFEFLSWIKENNYTFREPDELFEDWENFVDFHGNLNEYSSSFMYRIYDKNFLNELKEKVNSMKI